MFNIQNKYNGPGCYRFLNSQARTIYVGKSKGIHTRLFSQHFKKNGGHGHLPLECYKSTCKIEIIETKDHAQALALEQYLIDTYIPKYNEQDKRKDPFNPTNFADVEYYKNLEKWKLYYTFREFDKDKIKLSNRQNRLALVITFIFFISILAYLGKGLL